MPLTQHAHRQFAGRADVPVKFYDRLREKHPDLLADMLNGLLQREPENRMVRTLDGKARAFLSDRYAPLDNDQIAEAVLPVFNDIGEVDIVSSEITETRMYLKAVFPRVETEVTVGDVVQAGVAISNSEVGAGSLQIQPLVYRLVCKNGLIVPDAKLKRHHIGGRLTDEDMQRGIYGHDTMRASAKAFFLRVRDTVKAAANEAQFHRYVARLNGASKRLIEGDLNHVVEVTQSMFKLSDGETGGILNHLARGGDMSQWGLANAFTAYSQEVNDYDRATDFETMGGVVIDLSATDWRRIAIVN